MFSFLFQKNYLLVFTLCYILFVTFDHLFSIPSKDTDIECKEDYNTKNSFNISSCCVTNCPTKEFFNWSFKSWVSNQLSWSYPFREGINALSQLSRKRCNQTNWFPTRGCPFRRYRFLRTRVMLCYLANRFQKRIYFSSALSTIIVKSTKISRTMR